MSPFKHFKLFLPIAIALFACCTPQKKAPEFTWLYHGDEIEKLKGHIKQVTDSRYNITKTTDRFTFDRAGILQMSKNFLVTKAGNINT
nr:hypothetical protein [Mucilaginibacter sp. L294]